MEATSCENNSCTKEYCPDRMQEGDELIDIQAAKSDIAYYLRRDNVFLNTVVDIILYNRDTLYYFLMNNKYYSDHGYECMNCSDAYEREHGIDCSEGKKCTICPYYSFIPSGFEKFKSCNREEGWVGLSKSRFIEDVDEEIKKSLSIRDSQKGYDIYRFEISSNIMNEFEGKSELLNYIMGLYPNHQFADPRIYVNGATLTVNLRCESPLEAKPAFETQNHDEAPF